MMPIAMQLVYLLLGGMVTAYLVLINQNLSAIKELTKTASEELKEHRLNTTIHESGLTKLEGHFERVEEQIKHVLETAKIAHERIDALKEART